MRIFFCLDSLNCGGVEKVVTSLANILGCQHEVSIIVVSSDSTKSFYKISSSVSIISIEKEYNKKTKFLSRVKLLRKYFKKTKPDVVLSFIFHINIYCYLATIFSSVKHIACERTNPYMEPSNLISKKLRDYVFKHSDGSVFQTTGALSYYNGKIKNAIIIPNPVFVNIPIPSPTRTRKKVICAAGRLVEQKDYPTLLKAFNLFSNNNKNYALHIYGEGRLFDYLHDFIKKNSIENVEIKKPTSDWLKQEIDSSVYVLSSIYEGLPNSLLEAMSVGIPSIATDCPSGGPDFLISNGKNGFLVNVKDYVDLANKMSKLVNDKQLQNEFATKNLSLIERFSIENISNEWLKYIKIIVGNQK